MRSSVAPGVPAGASLLTRVRLGLRALQVLEHDAGDPIYGPLLDVCTDSDVYRAPARDCRYGETRDLLHVGHRRRHR